MGSMIGTASLMLDVTSEYKSLMPSVTGLANSVYAGMPVACSNTKYGAVMRNFEVDPPPGPPAIASACAAIVNADQPISREPVTMPPTSPMPLSAKPTGGTDGTMLRAAMPASSVLIPPGDQAVKGAVIVAVLERLQRVVVADGGPRDVHRETDRRCGTGRLDEDPGDVTTDGSCVPDQVPPVAGFRPAQQITPEAVALQRVVVLESLPDGLEGVERIALAPVASVALVSLIAAGAPVLARRVLLLRVLLALLREGEQPRCGRIDSLPAHHLERAPELVGVGSDPLHALHRGGKSHDQFLDPPGAAADRRPVLTELVRVCSPEVQV